MGMAIVRLQHVNVTVPPAAEVATKRFYGEILGLEEIPKPEESRGRGGAWYDMNGVQLHVSLEKGVSNDNAKRHFCLTVSDLVECGRQLELAGIEVYPDDQPIEGWPRFYVRDPGGNKIEIAEDPKNR
jgi:catechol 2,3-dioxygenase-like lactoylglutathione lyase family enzyme